MSVVSREESFEEESLKPKGTHICYFWFHDGTL